MQRAATGYRNTDQAKWETMSYTRFAIYYVPPEGALAEFGAAWLGWDIVAGCAVAQLDLAGLDEITSTPRKYGFHGTLKPPFHLSAGCRIEALAEACAELAENLAPATCSGLELTMLGRFLALTPRGDAADLRRVADACVRAPDAFRAPPTAQELARRRTATLSAQQQALLSRWGYPHVMEEFRFHMTLSGRLPKPDQKRWFDTVEGLLPALPSPFVMDQIVLCGERHDGHFEVIHRYPLAG